MKYTIIIEYSEHGPPQIMDYPSVIHPGDELIIEVRDYSPPPECDDDLEQDDYGSSYYTDAVVSIRVEDGSHGRA